MDLEVKYKNERDVEIPLLLDFIRTHTGIKKVLDIGCARSIYVPEIRKLTKIFDCIDFEEDKKLTPFLDNYFLGDATEAPLDIYDLVFAISVIEHYGIKQKPTINYQDKQIELVKKIGEFSDKYIFLTFPFGQLGLVKDEFAIVDDVLLAMFGDVLSEYKLETEFYFNLNPQSGAKWAKTTLALASVVSHDKELGVRCICVLKGVREDV